MSHKFPIVIFFIDLDCRFSAVDCSDFDTNCFQENVLICLSFFIVNLLFYLLVSLLTFLS